MTITTRTTDQKARVSLPKSFANATVIIEQAKVQIDLDQLIRAIQSLDAHERQQVREALDRDWAQDLDSILREVRARNNAAPMTEDEIAAKVEAARVAYHACRP